MAKFPNTTPIKGISHSWTQAFPTTAITDFSFEVVLKELVDSAVLLELEILKEIDMQVDAMTEFPEALALIKGAVK